MSHLVTNSRTDGYTAPSDTPIHLALAAANSSSPSVSSLQTDFPSRFLSPTTSSSALLPDAVPAPHCCLSVLLLLLLRTSTSFFLALESFRRCVASYDGRNTSHS